jgi:hypothetical protein
MARGRGVGAVFGIVLALAGVGLLVWNEGRSVARLHTIAAGRDAVVEADPARVDSGPPDRLLHLIGEAGGDRVADPDFAVALAALRLDRKVEMYQWVEQKRNRDGGTEYTYSREWRDSPQHGFTHPVGHENPGMPYRSARFYAGKPALGGYTLSRALLDEMTAAEPVAPAAVAVPRLPALTVLDGRLHSGAPAAPQVGDLRVGFTAVANQTVSVLAAAANGALVPFRTADGDLAMVEPGAMDAGAMLDLADRRNALATWAIRAAGTVAVFLGLMVLLRSAVAWIPFAQGLARGAATLLALVLAIPVALSAIAFAWLWFRPLWAVALLLAASAVPVWLALRQRRQAPARHAAATPPPPPR